MGSKYTKNQKKISKEASAKLVQFINTYPEASRAAVLAKSPGLFLGEFQKSAENRFNYVSKLRRTNHDSYKELVKSSRELLYSLNTPTPPISDGMDEERSSWGSQYQQTSCSWSTSTSIAKEPVPASKPDSRSTNASKMDSVPSTKPRGCQFETLQEAKDFADHVVYANFSAPEKTGHDIFCFYIDSVVTDDEKQQYDKVKVTLAHMADLRDYPFYSCMLVCYGQALLITKPTLPHFLAHEHKTVLAKDDKRTKQVVAISMNEIIQDKTRHTSTVLVVFPKDKPCNAKLSDSAFAPQGDQKIKTVLRDGDNDLDVKGNEVTQLFYPAAWTVYAVDSQKDIEPEAVQEDSLENAFEA